MRRSIPVAVVAAALLSTAPSHAQLGPPGQVVAEPETELVEVERPRPWLAVTGLILGVGSYGLSAGTGIIYLALIFPIQAAFGSDDPADVPLQLLIPAVGPLIAAGDDSLDQERDLRTLMYVNAGLQIGGAALVGASFLFKEKVLVRRPVDRSHQARRASRSLELERPGWVVGSGPRGSYGLSLSGVF